MGDVTIVLLPSEIVVLLQTRQQGGPEREQKTEAVSGSVRVVLAEDKTFVHFTSIAQKVADMKVDGEFVVPAYFPGLQIHVAFVALFFCLTLFLLSIAILKINIAII